MWPRYGHSGNWMGRSSGRLYEKEIDMTNYDVYFGTLERALDSLSLLLEFPDHPRPEVRDFQAEVKIKGVSDWMGEECRKPRWWAGKVK